MHSRIETGSGRKTRSQTETVIPFAIAKATPTGSQNLSDCLIKSSTVLQFGSSSAIYYTYTLARTIG